MEKVNHPNHYQGSSAESWDLTVLEWGPEYAIAAWVIQAQQYYDRHLQKNGREDVYKFYSESSNVVVDNDETDLAMDPCDFWQRVDFLKKMIEKACNDAAEADDSFSSMMSKCNSSWIVGMDLGSKDNK